MRPPKSGFPATAAFFDLDKTLIARSSTLAFGRSFYQHGLLSRTDMMRGAVAQFRYRLSGADHRQMEKLRASACAACRDWPAGGQPRPRTAPDRNGTRVARALVQHR